MKEFFAYFNALKTYVDMAAEFSQISNRNYRWFILKNVYINALSRSRLPPGMYNYTYSASKTNKAFKMVNK